MLDYKKFIKDKGIDRLCSRLRCQTDFQRLCVKSMIFEAIQNIGVANIKKARKAIFGNKADSAEVSLLTSACNNCLNVSGVLCKEVGFVGEPYNEIFNALEAYR